MFALPGARQSSGAGAADISRAESEETRHLPEERWFSSKKKRQMRLNAAAASAHH